MRDWHSLHRTEQTYRPVVSSGVRLAICLVMFWLMLAVVLGRTVQIESRQGDAFRREATRPIQRRVSMPGSRGRIIARDGTVLAEDREVDSLTVYYRWLEQPANEAWLRREARRLLDSRERHDAELVKAAEMEVIDRRDSVAADLAQQLGLTDDDWRSRAALIQRRVETIAGSVNRRRIERWEESHQSISSDDDDMLRRAIDRLFGEPMDRRRPERVIVAEELDYHVMAANIDSQLVELIIAEPERFPGVQVMTHTSRVYPGGRLASHQIGHLGKVGPDELRDAEYRGVKQLYVENGLAENMLSVKPYHPDDQLGRLGVERMYEQQLRPARGVVLEQLDRRGNVVASKQLQPAMPGADLQLTLDPELQKTAEILLRQAIRQRDVRAQSLIGARPDSWSDPFDHQANGERPPNRDQQLLADLASSGAAIVVLDVRDGQLLVAASMPDFDPNDMTSGNPGPIREWLDDPGRPLFNRSSQMAIPQGSLMKTVDAIAMLQSGQVVPGESMYCRGYLDAKDSHRCAIFTSRGLGHGDVTLSDALCESCNVFFFHHARELGPTRLVDWAYRLGLGRPTGIDLPNESEGTVPTPAKICELEHHDWHDSDTLALAIGQGSSRTTPLQAVRVIAAIANGGRLVTPHLVSRIVHFDAKRQPVRTNDLNYPASPIHELKPMTLAEVRDGLRRVVADPEGTAHATCRLETVRIAGKTGTAQTGPGRLDHAWFAGYMPEDSPRYAICVVLEHAGNASEAACPIAQRIILRMQQLGYFGEI